MVEWATRHPRKTAIMTDFFMGFSWLLLDLTSVSILILRGFKGTCQEVCEKIDREHRRRPDRRAPEPGDSYGFAVLRTSGLGPSSPGSLSNAAGEVSGPSGVYRFPRNVW